ncbi:MAG: hypothetical protein K1X89_08625 [Myxococcaceae bacterium]|nr:hypothetical protein [Myxococcaceae bacterium]
MIALGLGLLLAAADAGTALEQLPPGVLRLHVVAAEALDSDHLRLLARPGVTLWLTTDGNTLKESVIDTLQRFERAWVQLRAPLKPADLQQLSRVPRAGLWFDFAPGRVGPALATSRPVALNFRGPLDGADAAQLSRWRPTWLSWAPPPQVDLLQWGAFRQLPGRRFVVSAPTEPWPAACTTQQPGQALELVLPVPAGDALAAFPCAAGSVLEVPPEVEPRVVTALLAKDPSLELRVRLGADPARSVRTRKLLEALGVGRR